MNGARLKERWRGLSLPARIVVSLVGFVVAVDLLLEVLFQATGGSGPGGPTSSSFATAPDGMAAYAELLSRAGHAVTRLRQRLDTADLPADGTVIVAGTPLTNAETDTVRRFVDGGGHLLAAGPETSASLRRLLGTDVTWGPRPLDVAHPLVPVPEVGGVSTVRTAGGGVWSGAAGTLPVLGDGDHALAGVATIGAGRVLLLADPSPLQNRLLDRADNAAFGLAAVGPGNAAVVFAEAGHGFHRTQGLGALPRNWKVALLVGALATVVWMWAAGRRLGPAQEDARPLAPPRRAYVDAVAATLAKTGQPAAALEPLRAATLGLLTRRAGGRDVRAAAAELGLASDEIAAVLNPGADEDGAALARAMARLQGETLVERW
ncbi:MAG TPA: DUF4350 domain-containing protein [Acidimicrobiales bacterium]|nr:DUF4350 domain-containing protein [Acidimicrobiales bacterium]